MKMEKTVDKELTKLPEISETSKVATLAKSYESNSNSNVDHAVSSSGILPKISSQNGERMGINTEYTPAPKRSKKSSFRLPVVSEAPLTETKSECGEDNLLPPDRKHTRQDDEKWPDIASKAKHEETRSTSKADNTDSIRVQRNSALQRELIFMHCSQTVSRYAYSYFKRFPSPIPLSRKKEKLMQKTMAANMPKAPPEKKPQPGELRSKDEYEALLNSLKSVQTKFVKRHKLAHKPEETHVSSEPNAE